MCHITSSAELLPLPLRPLTDADPALANLSLTRKNATNDIHIHDILLVLVGPMPTNVQPDDTGCPIGPPQLNVGKTNQMDAGHWYMRVRMPPDISYYQLLTYDKMSYTGRTNGIYIKHVTP
jgi:hypothetical protein